MPLTLNGVFLPIPQKQFAGAAVVNAFAILSTVALVSVGLRVLWLALRKLRNPYDAQSREYAFFSTQLGNYAACLLIGNTMSCIAGLIGIKWLINRGITEGGVCQAQAFIMQVGNWASAYFTVIIAVHTFNSLVLKKKKSVCVSIPTMITGWVIAAVVAAIPLFLHHPEGEIYGPSGFTCGVRKVYPGDQFIFHLLPIFIASFLSALFYAIVFLVLRGTLKIRGGLRLQLDPDDVNKDDYYHFMVKLAKSMLWYPIAYILLLVPYSVTFLLAISGFNITWDLTVFAFVCWFLLGVVNVLLFCNTCRVLGPFYGEIYCNDARKTMGSFGPSGYLEQYDYDQKSVLRSSMTQNQPPALTYQSPFIGQRKTSRSSLEPSHERGASNSSLASLGYRITPIDHLSYMSAVPPTAAEKPSAMIVDTRSTGLPVPPRPRTSPSLSISSIDSISGFKPPSPLVTPEGVWTIVSPTSGRKSEHWATYTSSQVSSPKRSQTQPALSAVKPTFSPLVPRPLMLSGGRSPNTSPHSQSQPLPSSSPPLRPLLLQNTASVNARSATPEYGFF